MDINIAIPVYNQPHLLFQLLDSLRIQRKYFRSIYIFDDCSSVDYKGLINTFDDLQIIFNRNTHNLGAMPNMQHAYRSVKMSESSGYIMVAHEDDLLTNDFFQTISNALSFSFKKPALILSYFVDLDHARINPGVITKSSQDYLWVKKKELVKQFVESAPIAFGSAIFNIDKYPDFLFDFEKYGEFADKPFLLSFLDDNDDVLLLTRRCYLLRSHVNNDTRWKMLKPKHVSNLIDLYWNATKSDDKAYMYFLKKYLAGFYADAYINLQLSGNTQGWIYYAFLNLIRGRLSLKYLLLKQKNINRFFSRILNRK